MSYTPPDLVDFTPSSIRVQPLDEVTLRILKRDPDNLINRAAVFGIDQIFGYADNQDHWQAECIEIARQNIVVAIRAAADGVRLIDGDAREAAETPAPLSHTGALELTDVFDMGFEWAMSLRGQTLEDSRAVGRTLFSDTFAIIADQIDTSNFNSFESADLGICAAKKIIHAALRSIAPHQDWR